jgi:hypothetical protein
MANRQEHKGNTDWRKELQLLPNQHNEQKSLRGKACATCHRRYEIAGLWKR